LKSSQYRLMTGLRSTDRSTGCSSLNYPLGTVDWSVDWTQFKKKFLKWSVDRSVDRPQPRPRLCQSVDLSVDRRG